MKATISGIRGVVGDDFGPRDVLRFCSGFAGLVKTGRCVMGRDTRPSGGIIYQAAAAALMGGGVDVVNLGMAPTPAVFRESRKYGAGVVITSSHNPTQWNGLKFVLNGRGINRQELADVTEPKSKVAEAYGTESEADSSYVQDVCGLVGRIPESPSILVDAGGGAASFMAPAILEGIGCRADSLDSDVPRPDPTAGGLDRLVRESRRYDAGIAFDMDGDRMILVMDGRVLPPDATLGLGIAWAMGHGHRDFVLSADTSVLVERYVTRRGGRVNRSPVGEANVVGAMEECGARVGGEGSSAGFILSDFNSCRDGMLASALVASMIPGGAAANALNEITGSCILRKKIPCSGDGIMEHMDRHMSRMSSEMDRSDGLRATLDDFRWVLVRMSNTEDVLRISAEAPTKQECQKMVRRAAEMARSYGGS